VVRSPLSTNSARRRLLPSSPHPFGRSALAFGGSQFFRPSMRIRSYRTARNSPGRCRCPFPARFRFPIRTFSLRLHRAVRPAHGSLASPGQQRSHRHQPPPHRSRGMVQRIRPPMQPHTLSRCTPEVWQIPEEAEIVGRVVGVVTYLNEPGSCYREATPPERADWKNKAQ